MPKPQEEPKPEKEPAAEDDHKPEAEDTPEELDAQKSALMEIGQSMREAAEASEAAQGVEDAGEAAAIPKDPFKKMKTAFLEMFQGKRSISNLRMEMIYSADGADCNLFSTVVLFLLTMCSLNLVIV